MKLTDVIRRPLITEKTTVIREDGRTLVFQVAMDANKIDIKRAVEQLLGSKVAERPHVAGARQVEAPGQVRGPPLGLEEGVREAAGTARSCPIPAGGVAIRSTVMNADSQIQPDVAWRRAARRR